MPDAQPMNFASRAVVSCIALLAPDRRKPAQGCLNSVVVRGEGDFPIRDLVKMKKMNKEEVYIIKTKKMFGKLKENIGLERKKLQQNFQQR